MLNIDIYNKLILNKFKNLKFLEQNILEKIIIAYLISTVSFILIYNLINYDVLYGYDAEAHLSYVNYVAMYLPQEFKLPLKNDTYEFFNPPIAYIFPALIQVLCRNLSTSVNLVEYCQPVYGKATQVFQTILYLTSIFIFMKIANILQNKKNFFNLNVFLTISLLTVNYRTINMIRGEPYILFFMSLLILYLIKVYKSDFQLSLKNLLIFSSCVGLLGLSRQWGLLLLPSLALIIFFVQDKKRKNYFIFMLIVFLIFIIIVSPFYFHLFQNYGSVTSFNMEPSKFDFRNQPLSFYIPISGSLSALFDEPIRGNFDNQLLPILYSDLWGDYWGYFSFTSKSLDTGRNQMLIGNYLGRVNLLSIFPTVLLIVAFSKLGKYKENQLIYKYFKYTIYFTFFGYLWFLIKYPSIPSGDTIKSTYMLQLFNLLGLSLAIYLDKLKQNKKSIYKVYLVILTIVFSHNLSAMLSHF